MSSRLAFRRLCLVVAALVAVVGLAGCGEEDSPQTTDAAACDYPTDGASPAKPVDPPDDSAPREGDVSVALATSVGDLTATLDSDRAPCTVASFRSLADQGWFDGTTCHRLTTAGIFVVQCGDPTGTGRGGPGYSFGDELDGKETYPAGTLAMANAGADTNGSQFFMVYRDSQLPPDYTVFGTLDEASVKILAQVASQGTETGQLDGPPKVPVEIKTVS